VPLSSYLNYHYLNAKKSSLSGYYRYVFSHSLKHVALVEYGINFKDQGHSLPFTLLQTIRKSIYYLYVFLLEIPIAAKLKHAREEELFGGPGPCLGPRPDQGASTRLWSDKAAGPAGHGAGVATFDQALTRTDPAAAAIHHQSLPVALLVVDPQPQLPVVLRTTAEFVAAYRSHAEARRGHAGGYHRQHPEGDQKRRGHQQAGDGLKRALQPALQPRPQQGNQIPRPPGACCDHQESG
jgi:hypothetical protein